MLERLLIGQVRDYAPEQLHLIALSGGETAHGQVYVPTSLIDSNGRFADTWYVTQDSYGHYALEPDDGEREYMEGDYATC